MNSAEVDQAILAEADANWQKVAMLISRVIDALALEVTDEHATLVATRVEALVTDGRLVAQGNLHNWRHSEIRRP
jgi:Protein of unknown function